MAEVETRDRYVECVGRLHGAEAPANLNADDAIVLSGQPVNKRLVDAISVLDFPLYGAVGVADRDRQKSKVRLFVVAVDARRDQHSARLGRRLTTDVNHLPDRLTLRVCPQEVRVTGAAVGNHFTVTTQPISRANANHRPVRFVTPQVLKDVRSRYRVKQVTTQQAVNRVVDQKCRAQLGHASVSNGRMIAY